MKNRFPSIDALRGLAAICIVIFHARDICWIGISESWRIHQFNVDINTLLGYLSAPFSFGYAAVPLFFVLSGYCIHRPHVNKLATDSNYKLDITNYIKRRFWRIYPVLFATLALTFTLDTICRSYSFNVPRLGDTSFLNFLLNILSLQGILGTPYGSNGPLWTLGMELHFYLVYPILFCATKKFGAEKTLLAVILISAFATIVMHKTHSDLIIFLPLWYVWALGFFVAEFKAGRSSIPLDKYRKAVLFFSLTAACLIASKRNLALATPLFALFATSFLLWSLDERNKAYWESFWARTAAFVGIFSYSLYAIHFPILVFLNASLQKGMKSQYVIVPFVFTLINIVISIIMFQAVERWSLKLSANGTRSQNLTQSRVAIQTKSEASVTPGSLS